MVPIAAASGIAAERRAVFAGMQDAEDVAVGYHRRHRHDSAAEGFAEQIDVGHHTPVVAGEGATGARQPGLDLVGDHQHVALACRPRARGADSRRAAR